MLRFLLTLLSAFANWRIKRTQRRSKYWLDVAEWANAKIEKLDVTTDGGSDV